MIGLSAAGTLVAFGGAYSWILPPLLAAAALIAWTGHARPGHGFAWLDAALLLCLGAVAVTLVPLPPSLVDAVSPAAGRVVEQLHLVNGTTRDARLSIDPPATLRAFGLAVALALIFLGARSTFENSGGVRSACRAVAWTGLLMSLMALAQHATAPELIFWTWRPFTAGRPFGPFVNRNHFAGWLLLASGITGGYLWAHVRSHGDVPGGTLRQVVLALGRGRGPELAAGFVVMIATIGATLSRSAVVGLVFGAGVAWMVGQERLGASERRRLAAAALLVAIIAVAVADRGRWLDRVEESIAATSGRHEIWRATLPIIRDFRWTGTGAGTYADAMLVYQTMPRTVFFNQAHNHYLQLAAEGGALVGTPLILALVAAALAGRRRLRDDTSEMYWIRLGALAGLSAIALQSVWETSLRMPANGVLAAILVAILVHSPRPYSHETPHGAAAMPRPERSR